MSDLTPTLPTKTPGGYTVMGNLEELLDAVVAKLQAATLIESREVKVMAQHEGDLYTQLGKVINSKLGVLIMVALEGVNSKANGMTPSFGDTTIAVLCYEAVLFNQGATGSKVSALTLAELACKVIHGQPLDPDDVSAYPEFSMTPENSLSLDADRSELKSGIVCYVARFTAVACPKASLLSAE